MNIAPLTPTTHRELTIAVPMPSDAWITSYPVGRHDVGSDGEENRKSRRMSLGVQREESRMGKQATKGAMVLDDPRNLMKS